MKQSDDANQQVHEQVQDGAHQRERDGTPRVLVTSCVTALAKAKDFSKDGHCRTQAGLSTKSSDTWGALR